MSMEFCKECGTMLKPEKRKGKMVLVCPKCGEKRKNVKKGQEIVTKTNKDKEKAKMVVIENPDELNTMPTKKMECPKCKENRKVQYWTVQTRSGDEAATRFFRCTKCKATWREYD